MILAYVFLRHICQRSPVSGRPKKKVLGKTETYRNSFHCWRRAEAMGCELCFSGIPSLSGLIPSSLLRLCHSREDGNPGSDIFSGHPPEFTPAKAESGVTVVTLGQIPRSLLRGSSLWIGRIGQGPILCIRWLEKQG